MSQSSPFAPFSKVLEDFGTKPQTPAISKELKSWVQICSEYNVSVRMLNPHAPSFYGQSVFCADSTLSRESRPEMLQVGPSSFCETEAKPKAKSAQKRTKKQKQRLNYCKRNGWYELLVRHIGGIWRPHCPLCNAMLDENDMDARESGGALCSLVNGPVRVCINCH